MRRDIPAAASGGDDRESLAVVFNLHAEQATEAMLETDPLARTEEHHLDVDLHQLEPPAAPPQAH